MITVGHVGTAGAGSNDPIYVQYEPGAEAEEGV